MNSLLVATDLAPKPVKLKSIGGTYDLAVLQLELRIGRVRGKSRIFYPLLERATSSGKACLIVPDVDFGCQDLIEEYISFFEPLLVVGRVHIIFVEPLVKNVGFSYFISLFFRLLICTRSYGLSANLAQLMLGFVRRKSYLTDLYFSVSAMSWVGLSGGVELPLFKELSDAENKGVQVAALQYGVMALEQKHFENYDAHFFFTMDHYSSSVLASIASQDINIESVGSLEGEYLSEGCDGDYGGSFVISFIDQPIFERGEYNGFPNNTLIDALNSLADLPSVEVNYVPHPRSSSINFDSLNSKIIKLDSESAFKKTNLVIGFFSNLLDVFLLTKGEAIYIEPSRVYGQSKIEWIQAQGGMIIDDINNLKPVVFECIGHKTSRPRYDVPPSQKILETLNNKYR